MTITSVTDVKVMVAEMNTTDIEVPIVIDIPHPSEVIATRTFQGRESGRTLRTVGIVERTPRIADAVGAAVVSAQ